MSVAPTARPIVQPAPRRAIKAPYKTEPLYREIHEWQDCALDGVAVHLQAVPLWAAFEDLDRQSDAKFREAAREARARGMHRIADLIDEGLFLDHQERQPLERIWRLFGEAGAACREIVRRVEALFGRGGRS